MSKSYPFDSLTVFLLTVFIFMACQSEKNDRIVIPGNINISNLDLLDQIQKASSNDPTNERLLKQELYYCDQLEWPSPCGETLLRAKKQWGFTEELIDQTVTYHLKHRNYEQLQSALKGAVETRPRLEAKIRIVIMKNEDPGLLLKKYLDHYDDKDAIVFSLIQYLEKRDTTNAIIQFERLCKQDPSHELMRDYYPLLMRENDFNKSLYLINNQLVITSQDSVLLFDKAISLYSLGYTNEAKIILKKPEMIRSNRQLVAWYRSEENWDSAIVYLDKLLILKPADRNLLLAKAETLESKKWVTRSLVYYEQVLQMNPTDSVMAKKVEIVRRKVAYLRRIKEQKKLRPILNLERKTTTDN
ncbi:MAG: hypothetical protein GY816_14025 [Cytophagales bacterium]|nr:hypothetical protein [Cytophagales bacterium]